MNILYYHTNAIYAKLRLKQLMRYRGRITKYLFSTKQVKWYLQKQTNGTVNISKKINWKLIWSLKKLKTNRKIAYQVLWPRMSNLPSEQVFLSDQTELHHQHFLQSSQSHSLGLQLQHHVYPKDQENNKQTGTHTQMVVSQTLVMSSIFLSKFDYGCSRFEDL